MIFIVQCARLLFKKMREKADECAITFTYPRLCCETEVEVRLMIEADLLVIIYLLFYGMITLTIINVALIIATAILLIKQQ